MPMRLCNSIQSIYPAVTRQTLHSVTPGLLCDWIVNHFSVEFVQSRGAMDENGSAVNAAKARDFKKSFAPSCERARRSLVAPTLLYPTPWRPVWLRMTSPRLLRLRLAMRRVLAISRRPTA